MGFLAIIFSSAVNASYAPRVRPALAQSMKLSGISSKFRSFQTIPFFRHHSIRSICSRYCLQSFKCAIRLFTMPQFPTALQAQPTPLFSFIDLWVSDLNELFSFSHLFICLFIRLVCFRSLFSLFFFFLFFYRRFYVYKCFIHLSFFSAVVVVVVVAIASVAVNVVFQCNPIDEQFVGCFHCGVCRNVADISTIILLLVCDICESGVYRVHASRSRKSICFVCTLAVPISLAKSTLRYWRASNTYMCNGIKI